MKDTVCPNGILAKEYDTATQIMGSDWRMPTPTDFQELLENTENEWISDYNGTGVNGRKFTSKTDKTKYIFISAAGLCYNSSVDYLGRKGFVWSSSLNTSDPYFTSYLDFDSGDCDMSYGNPRCYGMSVRGVRK